MEYKASLSNTSKSITIFVALLITGFAAGSLFKNTDGPFWPTLILISIIISLLIGWAYSVKSYKIENGFLTINRPAGSRQFSLHALKKVERIPRKDLWMSFRLFGSGGFFGYYGRFYSMNYGSMRMYATNLNNAVMITLNDGRKIVITPDEPENFTDAITSATTSGFNHSY